MWLEKALVSYTFNDADRIQYVCRTLSNRNFSSERLIDLLNELLELV